MSLLTELKMNYHTCSIEKLPSSSGHSPLFVCGSYELDENSSTRVGSVALMKYEVRDAKLTVVKEYSCESGVLDMKLCGTSLGCAMSDGSLDMYTFDADHMSMDKVTTVSMPDEGLFLSLDFENRLINAETETATGSRIAVSTQSSSVVVYKYAETQLIQEAHMSSTHTMLGEPMPAWIVAFDPHSRNTLLSGGDDCRFRLWDVRIMDNSGDSCTPIAMNKRHTAGVTSVQWHPHDSNVFVTGSYDEHAIVWDQRNLSQPLLDIHTGELLCLLFLSSAHGIIFAVCSQVEGCGVQSGMLTTTATAAMLTEATSISRRPACRAGPECTNWVAP